MNTEFLLVLIFFVCLSFCYPTKPLNERSTGLTWEAWLLVDQSNRDVGMLRRKITPKSVFITPTFSPESLPACADGYQSDIMGRCVSIIKINESAHFKFLGDKIRDKFADYEDVMEETATPGPLQFNIPLFADVDDKLEENETEVAIVLTPSSKNHRDKTVQVDVRRKTDKFGVEDVAAILGVKPEEVEMTTIAELGTTVAMSTMKTDEATTLETTTPTTEAGTTEVPSTTETETVETTTSLEGEALFFQLRI